MSRELSLAALRRTSCERWPSAAVGSSRIWMLYSPPDAAEQAAAAAAKLPDGLWKIYQLSVGVPPPPPVVPPPHAASSTAAMATISPRRQPRNPPSPLHLSRVQVRRQDCDRTVPRHRGQPGVSGTCQLEDADRQRLEAPGPPSLRPASRPRMASADRAVLGRNPMAGLAAISSA
jgi:hypothetical protein